MIKILILGGTKFIGKNFVKNISNSSYEILLANRGLIKTPDIIIDRDNEKECTDLGNYRFDIIIDFSCYNLRQFKNTYKYLKFNKYIFISSSAVEGIPFQNVSPDMYEMAKYAYEKKECEDFIINNIKSYSIIRPCYVVGEGDYTNRFHKKNNKYYWQNGLELTYFIEVDKLSKIIFDIIEDKNNLIFNPCK